MWWLVQLAFSAEPAPGEVPPPSSAAPAPVTSASHRIDAAVSLYLAGETTQARRILQGVLVDGGTLGAEERQVAMAWLGDIQFAEQGISAAQSVLAALLAENPDYSMDPMVHPPEFCEAFERLRADLASATPRATKVPYPWQIGLPLGVGYFLDGRPRAGFVAGGLQVAGIVTSFAAEAELMSIRKVGVPKGDEAGATSYRIIRTIGEVGGATAWLAWGVPVAIETASWSAARRPSKVTLTSVELHPNGIALAGKF
jgi:hypothetical protein